MSDKRLLEPLHAFLTVGIMENGLVSPVDEGTLREDFQKSAVFALIPEAPQVMMSGLYYLKCVSNAADRSGYEMFGCRQAPTLLAMP